MATAAISVRHLSRRFGAVNAVQDVSFDIQQGEVLGLIGPNGSGKTTLLEGIAGVQVMDGGEVVVQGRTAHAGYPEGTVFFLPDGIAPWPQDRVSQLLAAVPEYFGGHRATVEPLIDALALAPLMQSRCGVLSKGQRKRVLLALALAVPHPILLLDEPFEGLDLRQMRRVGEVLREAARAGRTLCLSIHQIHEAARVCDRFVVMDRGRCVGQGCASTLAGQAGLDPAIATLEDSVLALS